MARLMDAGIIRLQNTFPSVPMPAPRYQNEPKEERKAAERRVEGASDPPRYANNGAETGRSHLDDRGTLRFTSDASRRQV